ncbi:hypothetical protein [Streptomyces sp. NBC_01373]|uniref:hypothetical protein n=1 Tax=Streptomyces sp. NBC_01373 TaxID=2903843 RepID=UPI0022580154|nr:hypothetical protein [Streptomyces sp. NBC_01373]MCX4706676.1 hypothetical protein [Streptomyces sp. NBC_01373]
MPVLFFDIGATLADGRLEADGSLTLLPRPRVVAVLDSLREVPKGIISDPGTSEGAAASAAAALHEAFPGRFPDDGLVHWGPKNSRRLFDEAVASAAGAGAGAVEADECVFVGEDSQERAFAREAGMRTAAHPVFTLAAMENRPAFWTRIELPEGQELPGLEAVANEAEVVPVHVAPSGSYSPWPPRAAPEHSNGPDSPSTCADTWRTRRPSSSATTVRYPLRGRNVAARHGRLRFRRR